MIGRGMMARSQVNTDAFQGKKVTVIGLAREGLALARFLSSHGAEVTVSDSKPAIELGPAMRQLEGLGVCFSLGANRDEVVLSADLVFVSPGVPPTIAPLTAARRAGVPISSATRLFFQLCPGRTVGVTGSCGKSTTTTLMGQMLDTAGKKVLVGGNLGTPLLERLPEMGQETWAILELSSFQLESMEESPNVAVITNLKPDHLDRHASMEEYASSKANIFRHQQPDDYLLLNYDDPGVKAMAQEAPSRVIFFSIEKDLGAGGWLRRGELVVSLEGMKIATICPAAEVRLLGRHNLYNVLAASLAAVICGVEARVAGQVARSFRGLPHRLELVRTVSGVSYYNDSIATSPDRAIAAINAFNRPVVLISGGRDKRLPLDPLAKAIRQRCKAVVLYGEGGELLQEALAKRTAHGEDRLIQRRAHAFERAVETAASLAKVGDVVLLAPGFTSFDQFSSYEERGVRFKELVEGLR